MSKTFEELNPNFDYINNRKKILELEFGELAEKVAKEIFNELKNHLPANSKTIIFWQNVLSSFE